jgi:hypothetical protein
MTRARPTQGGTWSSYDTVPGQVRPHEDWRFCRQFGPPLRRRDHRAPPHKGGALRCRTWQQTSRICSGFVLLRAPLTNSNRRPPLYEEGPLVKGRLSCVVQSGWVPRWWVSSWAHLSIASSREDKADWSSLRWRISLEDRQAARGSVAPLGAKGCSRVSMCQIASVRRRARSIWATLAPRCLPMRALVRW